jgi:chemotaxis protein CheX
MMLNSEIQQAPAGTQAPRAEFTAMVGLAGDLYGVCVLRCTPTAAALMAAKMLGVDPAQAGDEKWDAVGEVCNMVAGNFKNKLPGLSERCMLSCPTVIAGSDYQCRSLAEGQALNITLLFEGNPLGIVLEIHDVAPPK